MKHADDRVNNKTTKNTISGGFGLASMWSKPNKMAPMKKGAWSFW